MKIQIKKFSANGFSPQLQFFPLTLPPKIQLYVHYVEWGGGGGGFVGLSTYGGFIKGILRGVRCTKSLRVLFLHRRPPSWTNLVLYSRAEFIFNEPAFRHPFCGNMCTLRFETTKEKKSPKKIFKKKRFETYT